MATKVKRKPTTQTGRPHGPEISQETHDMLAAAWEKSAPARRMMEIVPGIEAGRFYDRICAGRYEVTEEKLLALRGFVEHFELPRSEGNGTTMSREAVFERVEQSFRAHVDRVLKRRAAKVAAKQKKTPTAHAPASASTHPGEVNRTGAAPGQQDAPNGTSQSSPKQKSTSLFPPSEQKAAGARDISRTFLRTPRDLKEDLRDAMKAEGWTFDGKSRQGWLARAGATLSPELEAKLMAANVIIETT